MNTNNIEEINKIKEDSINITGKDKSNIQLYFESSMNISEIEGKENERTNKNIIKENDIDNSLNSYIYLDNLSIHQLHKDININIKNENNIKKKLTKEDLDNIPLPLFSCIYCSNDYISFRHLSNEILSYKYYNETSIYDMKILNKIINYQPIIDQYNNNFKLLDIIIKNTDYLKKYYSKQNCLTFYNSEEYKKFFLANNLKIKNLLLQKCENFIIRKKNKDLTNKRINSNKYINRNISYNRLSFHNNNNSIGKDNFDKIFGNIKNNNNTIVTGTGSHSSLNNIVSFSLNNNDNNNNNNLYFNNINIMENIMEKIEKNEESENDDEGGEEFLNFFGNESQNQIQKKMNKQNIIFEDKVYDIWNPDITLINEKDENENKDDNESKNKNLIDNKNNLSDNINTNRNNNLYNIKKNLNDDLNNNKIKINQIDKLDNNNNTQKIFSERKIKEIKKIFNSPQNSYIQKNKNNNLINNKAKNLCNINIKKNIVNKTNSNYNEDKNNDNHITYDFFKKKNLFNFKSFYINKNKKNSNNNNNLLNLFKNKKNDILDNNEFLCHTKDLNKETNLDKNKYKQKNNKKENEKSKNMTINTNSQDSKNLLFLLKCPKLISHSNKINPINDNINHYLSPKIIKKTFSSYKNIKNENYIIVKSKGENNSRNSTSRVNKIIDKTKYNNLSQFYENNIKIYNSRNISNKRKKILNNNQDFGDLIKSNSVYMNGNQKEKSGFSSSSHFQINLSKIIYNNKDNGKINDLMIKINKKNNFKININDFAFFNKNKNKNKNNMQKIKYNFHSPPLISKRNESASKPLSQKKNLITKLKL